MMDDGWMMDIVGWMGMVFAEAHHDCGMLTGIPRVVSAKVE